jgi:UDP-N-acetylmuramate dehydrogenase
MTHPVLQEYVSLQSMNTFQVKAYSRFFKEITQESELASVFQCESIKNSPLLILGGGSNILLTKNFEGLTLKINLKGITHSVDNNEVLVTAAAGESWEDVVQYCIKHNFAGVENLTSIPGTIGAAPVQNIGAYGVEFKDVFYQCKAYEISTGKTHIFHLTDCEFGYRESVFKSKYLTQYIITAVTLKLSLKPTLKTSYGAINQELSLRGIRTPTIQDIYDIVKHIRTAKLPNPTLIANAGSFFKNPMISQHELENLKIQFPNIVYYSTSTKDVKLAAGWLIESCGWKGKQIGSVSTWKNQALVIVNIGDATGREIFDFSEQIIDSVYKKFGLRLEREVNVI